MQEVTAQRDMNKQLEEGLEKYRRKLNVIKHQTGLLYKDFHEKQQQWTHERQHTNEVKHDLQTEIEKNIVKLQEFDVNDRRGCLEPLESLVVAPSQYARTRRCRNSSSCRRSDEKSHRITCERKVSRKEDSLLPRYRNTIEKGKTNARLPRVFRHFLSERITPNYALK